MGVFYYVEMGKQCGMEGVRLYDSDGCFDMCPIASNFLFLSVKSFNRKSKFQKFIGLAIVSLFYSFMT